MGLPISSYTYLAAGEEPPLHASSVFSSGSLLEFCYIILNDEPFNYLIFVCKGLRTFFD